MISYEDFVLAVWREDDGTVELRVRWEQTRRLADHYYLIWPESVDWSKWVTSRANYFVVTIT